MNLIASHPNILGGKPVINGTRIPVSLVLNLLAHGYSIERIIETYPRLKKNHIQAAIQYAAVITNFEEKVYA